ncbi:MAG: exo-alpha-sialidase, partial [Candidatus Hydrogenedentes bacterium]|nr:exo-alpha-sialidase [Candidatus Hydrogenedentota bacterium]
NSAGYIGLIENFGGGASPKWGAPQDLRADGDVIRITAGENGSIQGPCEAKWGQTVLSVADWDMDGLADLIVNSMWGEILWYKNIGSKQEPELARGIPVEVAWGGEPLKPRWNWWDPTGNQLITQWRTTPVAVDFTNDGLVDLVMIDHEGYLALYERRKNIDRFELLPPQRIFVHENGEPIQLNDRAAGGSGRRKLDMVDWDGDGRLDLLVDATNVDWWRNYGSYDGKTVLKKEGPLGERELAKHSTSATTVDWDNDAQPDLLLGAEDGFFYHLSHEGAIDYSTQKKSDVLLRLKKHTGLSTPSAVVDEEFIFTDISFDQFHGLTLAEAPTGLTAACSGSIEGRPGEIGVWVSRHNGTWTDAIEGADGVQYNDQKLPCKKTVLVQIPKGPLLLFYQVQGGKTAAWGEFRLSYDAGRVWQEPRRLPWEITGPNGSKPLILPDGTLQHATLGTRKSELSFEMFSISKNSWHRTTPLLDGVPFTATEPTLLKHHDGTLQLLCRTEEGIVLSHWTNGGKTNKEQLTLANLPGPVSEFDAIMLQDNRLLIVYTPLAHEKRTLNDKSLLYLAISQDGLSWQQALRLEEQEKGGISELTVLQTDDGLIHVVYFLGHLDAKHVTIDPAKFE